MVKFTSNICSYSNEYLTSDSDANTLDFSSNENNSGVSLDEYECSWKLSGMDSSARLS